MPEVVYDTGALLAAERRDWKITNFHEQLRVKHVMPCVPVVVLAQAWRGGPQHAVSRLLKGCDILVDDERIGRAAGVVCAAAGTSDVVDALVVVVAVARDAVVVTSDPHDLKRLADAVGVKLKLFSV